MFTPSKPIGAPAGKLRLAVLMAALALGPPVATRADRDTATMDARNFQVRVAVARDARAVAVKLTRDGSVWSGNAAANKTLKAGVPYLVSAGGGGNVELKEMNGVVVARFPRSIEIRPVSRENTVIFLEKVDQARTWTPRTLDAARRYRGLIECSSNPDGRLTVVNHVWLEHYLYGVIAAEIGADAPIEAMKAQAVAARSEALYKIEHDMKSDDPRYDFTDGTSVMTYKGAGVETDTVRQAVDATRGEVLVHEGHPIDAVYSDTCGGVISSSRDHWKTDGAGYSERLADRVASREIGDLSDWREAHTWTSKSDIDVMCNPNQIGFPKYAKDHFRWRRTFTSAELTRMFGVGAVKDIITDERTPSGRIRKIRVVGEKKTTAIDMELPIREAFGDLKSSFFTYVLDRDDKGRVTTMNIWGAGYGHGVGMCQMGAYMMAKRRYTYRQILGLYYCKVKIRRLYG